jgi:hypothetical protein
MASTSKDIVESKIKFKSWLSEAMDDCKQSFEKSVFQVNILLYSTCSRDCHVFCVLVLKASGSCCRRYLPA